jgi:hypothetical protein
MTSNPLWLLLVLSVATPSGGCLTYRAIVRESPVPSEAGDVAILDSRSKVRRCASPDETCQFVAFQAVANAKPSLCGQPGQEDPASCLKPGAQDCGRGELAATPGHLVLEYTVFRAKEEGAKEQGEKKEGEKEQALLRRRGNQAFPGANHATSIDDTPTPAPEVMKREFAATMNAKAERMTIERLSTNLTQGKASLRETIVCTPKEEPVFNVDLVIFDRRVRMQDTYDVKIRVAKEGENLSGGQRMATEGGSLSERHRHEIGIVANRWYLTLILAGGASFLYLLSGITHHNK